MHTNNDSPVCEYDKHIGDGADVAMKNPLLDDVQQATSSSEDTTVHGMSETDSEIQRGEAIDGKERVKMIKIDQMFGRCWTSP